MSAEKYEVFKNELHDALKADGLEDFDVRLQGSSVAFYSGHHKKMPFLEEGEPDRDKIYALFCDGHGVTPAESMLDVISDVIAQQWPSGAAQPTRRPFDSMYRLNLSTELSDYDVQISCDEILRRAESEIQGLRVNLRDAFVKHPSYRFIQKKLMSKICPNIIQWQILQSAFLGRPVTVAAFPGHGPDNCGDEFGAISSHFRPSDWVVNFDD